MNWLIGWIVGPAASVPRAILMAKVLIWGFAALAAIAAALWGLYAWRGYRIDALTATVNTQTQALEAATDANTQARITIEALSRELGKRKQQDENTAKALAEVEEVRQRWILTMQSDLRKLRAELESIYASNEDCAALRRVPVCGPLTERVLQGTADPAGGR